jgi:hypothetical protein
MFEDQVVVPPLDFQEEGRGFFRLSGVGTNPEFRSRVQTIYLVVKGGIARIIIVEAANKVFVISPISNKGVVVEEVEEVPLHLFSLG